jgi:uncharacterized protein (DUF1778 family)
MVAQKKPKFLNLRTGSLVVSTAAFNRIVENCENAPKPNPKLQALMIRGAKLSKRPTPA